MVDDYDDCLSSVCMCLLDQVFVVDKKFMTFTISKLINFPENIGPLINAIF